MSTEIRNKIALTDEQIEDRFSEFGLLASADTLIYTSETIEQFKVARQQWADEGRIEQDSDGVLVIEKAQAIKGQPRGDITIIDFGTARAVYR